MALTIRRAAVEDLDRLLSLYAYLHDQDDPPPPHPELERVWQEMLARPGLHCLIGECAGQLAASCVLVIIPNLTRGTRPYALIENVVTHPDFRRRGFARAILEHALHIAWEAGCYKVMLLSSADRAGAHGLYEQVGFERGVKVGFIAKPPQQDLHK